MKTLYYTVDIEINWLDDATPYITGNKSIYTYLIEDNKLVPKHTIHTTLDIKNKDAIERYLETIDDDDEHCNYILL